MTTDHQASRIYGLMPSQAKLFSNTLLGSIPDFTPPRAPGASVQMGFVGRLSTEKNPRFALEVLNEMAARGRTATLTIVGDGPLRTALVAGSEESRENVQFTGWIGDREALLARIATFDVLLLPSHTEGSPKIMVEAMALSKLVVTWPINDVVQNLAQDGEAAVLCSGLDAREWASRIACLIGTPEHEAVLTRAHAAVQGRTVEALVSEIRACFSKGLKCAMGENR